MSFTIHRLVNPTSEQIKELRNVFDAAFSTERGVKSIVGTEFETTLSVLNRSTIVAGILGGEIYVAEDDDKIIGGIIWYGPGREQYDRVDFAFVDIQSSSEDQRKEALIPLLESLPANVKEWMMKISAPQMEAFKKRVFGNLAKTEWYLQRVGVHPDWQGKGIGTALIEHGRRMTHGRGIVLEAVEPHNVAYFEYLGFKVRGRIEVEALYGFTVTGLLWKL